LRVVCDGLKSYERFTREQLATLPGVRSIESSFALGQVKRRRALP
ncbi:MAG: Lrp/AsnC ligand binding domain-containing protein, partial [Pseudomonadota bacterium]